MRKIRLWTNKNQYGARFPEEKVLVYDDSQGFLNDESIDMAFVASISGYHARHVLIEKPIAQMGKDADRNIVFV